MAVSYTTLEPYPKGQWNNGDFYGETKLKCAWDAAGSLLTEIDDSPNWPSAYAFGPDSALAYDVQVEPLGQQINSNQSLTDYKHAILTVKYTTKGPQWVANHGAITEEFGAEAFTMPTDQWVLRWGDGFAVSPDKVPGPTLYIQTYRVTWHWTTIPAPSYWAALVGGSLVGCTNSNVVKAFNTNRTFAVGTLRFVPPTITTTYSLARVARTKVVLTLQYHPYGWNTFWRSENNAFEALYNMAKVQYRPYTPAVFPSA